MTHTYALLEVSPPVFNEIAQKLKKAGYDHAFTGKNELDMHGLALTPDPDAKPGDTTIVFTSMVSQRTKEGLVQMRVNDHAVQMTLDKARELVSNLHGAIEAAASDQIFFQFFKERMATSDEHAGRALMDLRELRQGSREMVIPS